MKELIETLDGISDDDLAAEIHAFDREWSEVSRRYETARLTLALYLAVLKTRPEVETQRKILWDAWIAELKAEERENEPTNQTDSNSSRGDSRASE